MMTVDTKSLEWQMALNSLFLLHHVSILHFTTHFIAQFILTDRIAVHEREDPPPLRAADISLPPALRSPSYLNDSSWIYQPLGQPLDQSVADHRWHVSDPVYEGRSGTEIMPISSTDTHPVTTPVDPQFREYSASDPGAQEYAEWHSASGSRQRSGSWHECMSI